MWCWRIVVVCAGCIVTLQPGRCKLQAPSHSSREHASPPGLRVSKSVPLELAAGIDIDPASSQQVYLRFQLSLDAFTTQLSLHRCCNWTGHQLTGLTPQSLLCSFSCTCTAMHVQTCKGLQSLGKTTETCNRLVSLYTTHYTMNVHFCLIPCVNMFVCMSGC